MSETRQMGRLALRVEGDNWCAYYATKESMVDAVPALMAGCSVVLKPSEVTQRYVDPLREIIASVAELAPVFAIVRGPGATGADLVTREIAGLRDRLN